MSRQTLAKEGDAATKALDDAREFAESGSYAEALERHEWFHENALAVRPSLGGVRLSFALRAWKRLGDNYPPALVSLKAIRDDGLKALSSGEATRETFGDVSSINRALGEDESTIRTFEMLRERHPELATKCFSWIQDLLLAKNESEIFLSCVGDMVSFMKRQIDRHQDIAGETKARKDTQHASLLKHRDNKLVDTTLQLIRIARKEGDSSSAKKVRDMTVEVVDDPRLALPGMSSNPVQKTDGESGPRD